MSSFDALGPSDATSVRVKIRVHPSGEHYVRVPKTVREAIARREGETKECARSSRDAEGEQEITRVTSRAR